MGFAEDIRRVLEIEREGKKRLADAEAEARSLVEAARGEARRLLEEGEADLARKREERTAEMQAVIAREVEKREDAFREEKSRLRRLAENNRAAAVEQVLAWLRGEG